MGATCPGTPSLPQKRYMDNQTHALSLNWLERLNKEKELTFNAVYTYDDQRREGYTYTEHYRPQEASVGIHETQTSRDRVHHLELAHKYTNNAERNYCSNDLSARISWNDAIANGLTTSQTYNSTIGQEMRSTPFSIQDAAVVQCLLGENIFRFNLRAGYFDAMKLLYGLKGRKWYLDAQWDEKAAYDYLCGGISHFLTTSGKNFTMRELHEKYIPAAAKVLEVKSPDYRDVLLAYLEEAARETGLEQFQVYSEGGLVQRLGSTVCPEKVCRSFDAPKGLKKIATIFD